MQQEQEQFTIVSSRATAYAVKHSVNVFLFKTPEGFDFMEEPAARAAGIQPTHGIISYLQPVTT